VHVVHKFDCLADAVVQIWSSRAHRSGWRIGDPRLPCYGGVVAKRHQRFALLDVTFAGASLPSATMDCWEDSTGHSQWAARVVTRTGPILDEGELTGRTADGRAISGHALVAGRQVGAGGRRETLVEFHGSGDLRGLDGE
jgi:hypothetical protein